MRDESDFLINKGEKLNSSKDGGCATVRVWKAWRIEAAPWKLRRKRPGDPPSPDAPAQNLPPPLGKQRQNFPGRDRGVTGHFQQSGLNAKMVPMKTVSVSSVAVTAAVKNALQLSEC